jgi:hydrogenase maturation protease
VIDPLGLAGGGVPVNGPYSDDVAPILVLGVGNPLMRDEGVGPRTVEFMLEGFELPESVEIIDAGTMGYMMLDLLRGRQRLLVIDAMKDTGHDPGTVLLLSAEDIAPNTVLHSMHDLRVVDVLQAGALMGIELETLCVGVQIESIEEWVTELSEPVQEAIPVATSVAFEVLREWGVEPTPREGTSVEARIIRAMRTYEPMGGQDDDAERPEEPTEAPESSEVSETP